MRCEFAHQSGIRIEPRRKVAYVQPMQSAENTLRVVSYLSRAIEIANFSSHRLLERQQPVHPEFLASRDNPRVSAAFESRTDRNYRDTAVVDFDRMENISPRRVVKHRAQRHPVCEQVEIHPARDLHQVLAERFARALRNSDQPLERISIVFLAPRDRRRAVAIE